jgi:uncharacterized protein
LIASPGLTSLTIANINFQALAYQGVIYSNEIYIYSEQAMNSIIYFPFLLFGLLLPYRLMDASQRCDLSLLNSAFPASILQAANLDETGITALMQAVQDENLQEVQLQFLEGADANAKDAFGWTALMYAIKFLNMGNIVTLLEHKANINAKDQRGRSALMWAVLTGKADLIKLLLEKGADVNAVDNNGATALSFAMARGHNKIAALIKAAGGNGPSVTKNSVPEQIAPIDELPKVLKVAYPEYPKEASESNTQGKVHLHVLIKKDGRIGEIRVARGLSYGLTESAITAVSKLTMRPGINNGQAVDFWIPLQVEFYKK